MLKNTEKYTNIWCAKHELIANHARLATRQKPLNLRHQFLLFSDLRLCRYLGIACRFKSFVPRYVKLDVAMACVMTNVCVLELK